MTGRPGRAASAALALPAAAYGLAVRLRNAWYEDPRRVRRAPIPVVSVGNLAVGGTGKTPVTAWLARRLLSRGLVPAVVSRGYGGTAGPGPLIVSTGDGPRVDARACGDEPFLLARSLAGAIVVVGADRLEGVRAAAAAGAAAAVLDDGFQHRALARDLDVVLLDGRDPFGNGRMLPAGPLREPAASLRRAGIVLLTRLDRSDRAARPIAAVRKTGFAGPIARAGHVRTGFVTPSGEAAHAPRRALAFCGIADPELFRSDLLAAGVAPAAFLAFRDHAVYDAATWERILARARDLSVPLVTTEKDLARLDKRIAGGSASPPLLALRVEARVWDERELDEALTGALAAAPGGAP